MFSNFQPPRFSENLQSRKYFTDKFLESLVLFITLFFYVMDQNNVYSFVVLGV